MSPIRTFRDLKDLYRRFSELLVYDVAEEEAASYELTVSARRFSRKTQAVVDDKLNFSATLMRAGEVDAANRLLAEFHDDVREEEAALIEKVNEVKVARSLQRDRLTKARLARVLAVALVGSSLIAFSAAGMAVAGFLKDRARTAHEAVALPTTKKEARAKRVTNTKAKSLRHVRIGQEVLKLRLTEGELKTIRHLASGSTSASVLDQLINMLPQQVAERVHEAMVAAGNVVAEAEETADEVDELALELPRVKKKDKKERKDAEETTDESAEGEPTPEPSESEDGSSEEGGSGSEDENRSGEEEDPDQTPPIGPLRPR